MTNFGGIEERVRRFELVRDIPYYIATGDEQDFSCATKNIILAKLLSVIGLQSRFIVCEFYWEDVLPEELLMLPHESPEKHEYLEVLIPETNEWVKVDCTWDSRLHSSFPVSEWDGLTSTRIAVPAVHVYSPEKSEEFNIKFATEPEDAKKEYAERNREFFIALNSWLESRRKLVAVAE